jgi:CBS-domain-containing membrane protein
MHTVDTYTDPFIPRSQVYRLPVCLSRFLGHGTPPRPQPNEWLVHLSVLVSTFAGLVVIMAVCKFAPEFIHHGVDEIEIIPSWGASAILIFNAMQAPLAQPRNVIFGTFISSLIGVCLMKLWMTNPANEDTLWLAGALSTAISSVLMTMTNTIHPPAGAAALLPAVDDNIRALGWWYLPVQLVSGVLIVGVACVMNNVVLQYPVYWWTAYKKPDKKTEPKPESVETKTEDVV